MFRSISFKTILLVVVFFFQVSLGQEFSVEADIGGTATIADRGDVVLRWNDEALNQVRTLRLGAFDAARVYAMLNVAMFDAANGANGYASRARFRPALIDPPNRRRQRRNGIAAASAAANAILGLLFPDSATIFQTMNDEIVEGILASSSTSEDDDEETGNGTFIRRGLAWGESVGKAVFELRSTDGSLPKEVQSAGDGPGAFRSDFGSAAFRNMDSFFVEDPLAYVSSQGPPPLDSREYAAAHTEVRLLGNAAYANTDYDEIFSFWKAGGGTVRPPGEWIKITQMVSKQEGTTKSLISTTLLFATMSIALADASIAVAHDKFEYQFWRPETAIREADGDGNDETTQDTTWSPRNGSKGGSPEHTSGQSAFAGVGSTVLAAFYGTDDITFEAEGDNAIAGPRSYPSFSDAAREAGRSRIYSGIHFDFSNQAGQVTGRAIAREIVQNWQQ